MTEYKQLPVSVLGDFAIVSEKQADQFLCEEREMFSARIVVLDDDPTGTQTVHDVPVYTDWTRETLAAAFEDGAPLFFILTNSRSFSREETTLVHKEIACALSDAARKTGVDFLLISRGDSTLRGHYPLETEILKETLESYSDLRFDGEIICPYFKEGGRFTIGNVHYVHEGEFLTPAGATEFAGDKTFGYQSSHLGEYVEEKSCGKYRKEDCIYISLEDLRAQHYDAVTDQLLQASGFQKIIVNAVDDCDVKVFSVCWLRAMKSGKRFMARSAAGLVKAIGNISPKPLLSREELVDSTFPAGGLIIVGSHVRKTCMQLNALKASVQPFAFLEFHVADYFTEGNLERETQDVLARTENLLKTGQTVVIYTSRELLIPDTVNKDAILKFSVNISEALTSIVHLLECKPKFIIAKGGITSSDVATKGLGIKKARVMGQIRKGIPVWMTGAESKFPDTPYIIFPGNVGEIDTLKEIAEELSRSSELRQEEIL